MATSTQRQQFLMSTARLLREPGEALTRTADHREALAAMRAAPQADREAFADELEQLAKTATVPARADRYDDDLSPRARFIAETADAWKSPKQRELDRRGDAALSPRDRFIAGTLDMSISKRARERGFDG
jgi:hypothetical protein